MKLATRLTLALTLGVGLLSAVPASAAPYSTQFTNVQQALVGLADGESDPAKKAALQAAAALFDNTSKSFATDLTDAMNAIIKLEKAYGTSDAAMTAYLDGLVQSAYLPVFFRGNQAYQGAATKLVAQGNYRAVASLAKSHAKRAQALAKLFPDTPNPSITRVKKMKALIAFEKYGFALAKRFKVTLNQF